MFNFIRKVVFMGIFIIGFSVILSGFILNLDFTYQQYAAVTYNMDNIKCPQNPNNTIIFIDSCPSKEANYLLELNNPKQCIRNGDTSHDGYIDHATWVLKTYKQQGGSKDIVLVTSNGSYRPDSFIMGLRLALKCGIKTISTSMTARGTYSKNEDRIIKIYLQNGGRYYAAAGNDKVNIDITPYYPASYYGVIAIGAKPCYYSADYTNYGTKVRYECGEDYGRGHLGTSFATPRAAAIDEQKESK